MFDFLSEGLRDLGVQRVRSTWLHTSLTLFVMCRLEHVLYVLMYVQWTDRRGLIASTHVFLQQLLHLLETDTVGRFMNKKCWGGGDNPSFIDFNNGANTIM